MKKCFLWLLSVVASVGVFDSASAITMLSHPSGTGSDVRFNQYEDAINLLENRGYGIALDGLASCVDLPPSLERDFEVAYPAGTISSGPHAGTPYPAGTSTVEWEDLYRNGFPFFGRTCLGNQYAALRSDSGFTSSDYRDLMDERNFSVARACSSADCGGTEPVLNRNTTSTYTTGTLPFYLKPESSCQSTQNIQMSYNQGSNECLLRPKLPNYSAIPQYRDDVANLSVGDRVRVSVYIHNTAQEYVFNISEADFNKGATLDREDNEMKKAVDLDGNGSLETLYNYSEYRNWSNQQYLNNLATGTEVEFDWSNPSSLSVVIDSDQTSPIADTIAFSYLSPGLGLVPVVDTNNTVRIERRNSANSSSVSYVSGDELTVPMGTVASSYGNVQELFVDFEVVLNPNSVGYDIQKTASTLLGVDMPNGTNITTAHGIGPGSSYEYTISLTNTSTSDPTGVVTITDVLNPNLQWVGTSDSGVTYDSATHTVTLVYQSIPAGVTIPDTKTFEVRVSSTLPTGLTPIVNTAVDAATGLSSSITLFVESQGGGQGLTLTKRAETLAGVLIPSGGNLTPGQIYRYIIRVENTSTNPTSSNVVLTDTLDPNISYIDSVPSGNLQISETNGVVTLDFGIVNPGAANAIELAFDVQVDSAISVPAQISNVAVGPGGLSTNVVLHNVGGGSGGNPGSGGSAPTVDTAGVCHKNENANTYECRKVYPEWNLNDPDYVEFKECMDNISKGEKTEDECLAEWVAKKEFTPCTLPEDFRGEQLGKDPEEIAYQECAAVEVFPPCSEWNGNDTNLTVTKKIIGNTVIPLSGKITYEVAVNVNTGDSARIFVNNLQEGLIEKAVVRVHDYVVPSRSGWLSDRKLISSTGEWTWNQAGHYFEKVVIDRNEINQLNSGGTQFVFQYTMDSGLVAQQNVCQIKNVAFGTVDFTLKREYQDANQGTKQITFDQNLRSDLEGEKNSCQTIYLEDLYSLGSDATAELKIVRPFLQTRGGANLGVQGSSIITGDSSEITNEDASSAATFTDGGLNDELSQSEIFQENFFTRLQNNVSQLVTRFGGQFIGTEDNSGIWFLSGNRNFIVPSPFEMGRSETFILENGDLIIDKDIRMEGESRNYIPAFIVKNGDIKIAPEVRKISGIFVALNGRILSGISEDGGVVSPIPLEVSGSLVGDAFDLLYNRRHIGVFEDGVLVDGLEPSVKITYDLRLVENTPPALENFLGNDWQQKVE